MNIETKHLWSHKCPKKWDQYTLIALVITIVILIILAGVAIRLTLGNNGLFNKAKEAKEKYQNAQEYEEEQIGKISNEIDNYVGSVRTLITKKVLFNNSKSSGTITFENDKISNYDYFVFIYGIHGFKSGSGRMFQTMVLTDYLLEETVSGDEKLIGTCMGNNHCSVEITNVTENSITFNAVSGGTNWAGNTCYLYKIIGIK